ncbi:hypothetical protein K0504_08150 [Neiella marina]|uniref:DUF3828 domain-containing protein n=1 Tax=Neiella holothuriorum TaxID=2870530 RepID=A0ABS7EF88_9GAMM|nr:hypothetical protein [Neiella holothuriorum]MBW8191004.1 hypothetical protein [Neiella holothuriorum]
MLIRLLITFLAVLSLCACQEENPKQDPEDIAVAFFHAIYVDGDVEKAKSLAGPELAELLGHYRNLDAVKRHIVGMEMSNPEIEVKDSSADFFRRLDEDVWVELHFKSVQGRSTIMDVRVVHLSQQFAESWVVDSIDPDPFATNG